MLNAAKLGALQPGLRQRLCSVRLRTPGILYPFRHGCAQKRGLPRVNASTCADQFLVPFESRRPLKKLALSSIFPHLGGQTRVTRDEVTRVSLEKRMWIYQIAHPLRHLVIGDSFANWLLDTPNWAFGMEGNSATFYHSVTTNCHFPLTGGKSVAYLRCYLQSPWTVFVPSPPRQTTRS